MGTRLQRQSQPISDSGERGVTQKHCLPVGCLGYSASVDTVAAISFSGAGVRNHCGRLGCSEFVGTVAAIGFCIAGVRNH
jgi:hypothetical protein